jgi:hypothetical protein
LLQVEGDKCPDCGQPWSEATDINNEFQYTAEVVRCHACATSAKRVAAYQESGGNTQGLHVHVQKRG